MAKKEDKILVEVKRHNKVLMEHMEKQVKTVAEQHNSIMDKLEGIDELKEDAQQLKGDMAIIKPMIKEINTDNTYIKMAVKEVDVKASDNSVRIKKIEHKVGV